jgi:hypothetical protein
MSGGTDWRQLLRCLEDQARRRLLVAILDRTPRSDALDVPEDVVPLGERDRETVQIAFEHVHLPMLESQGYVSWDRDAGVVTRGPAFAELRPLLELIEDNRQDLPDGWR